MAQLTWDTAADWDAFQSESGVVHESVANTDHTDAGSVKKGYSAASPYLSSDVVGAWLMQEDSGSTIYDFSGNGYDASVNGATPGQSNGLLGTSYWDFDGSDDDAAAGTLSELGSNPITIIVWFEENGQSQPNTYPSWVSRANSSGGDGWLFGYYDTDQRVMVTQPSVDYIVRSSSEVSQGWHHAAFTVTADRTNLTLYVDGVQEDTGDPSSTSKDFDPSSTDFVIGADQEGTTGWWAGPIGGVWGYSREFTQSEIQAHRDIVRAAGTHTTGTKTA